MFRYRMCASPKIDTGTGPAVNKVQIGRRRQAETAARRNQQHFRRATDV